MSTGQEFADRLAPLLPDGWHLTEVGIILRRMLETSPSARSTGAYRDLTMAVFDVMPQVWRDLANDFPLEGVLLAWLCGLLPAAAKSELLTAFPAPVLPCRRPSGRRIRESRILTRRVFRV